MPVVAETLVREAAPASVLDAGWGTGGRPAALRARGSGGTGREHPAAGLAACPAHGFGAEACLEAAERTRSAPPDPFSVPRVPSPVRIRVFRFPHRTEAPPRIVRWQGHGLA
jgi:hypothetical protein